MQQLSRATNNGWSAEGAPSVEACAARLVEVLPSIVWFIRRNMRRNRDKGLSVPAFRTLLLISRTPSASLSEVSDFLGASMSTASRIVSCLVSKKLISRKIAAEDRREISLQLTRAGEAMLESATTGTRAAVASQMGVLTPEQRTLLSATLDLLGKAFETTTFPVNSDVGGEICQNADLDDALTSNH